MLLCPTLLASVFKDLSTFNVGGNQVIVFILFKVTVAPLVQSQTG